MNPSKIPLAGRISYVPLSRDLSHPGDRRRIKIWSNAFHVPLNLSYSNKHDSSDLLILSSGSKLRDLTIKHKGPVIIDLVDGYLSRRTPFMEDITRNTLRTVLGKSSLKSITFTNELRKAISQASAVVVSCPEQQQVIKSLNAETYCILDDHSELTFSIGSNDERRSGEFTILWEGLGYTLKHLFYIGDYLQAFISSSRARLIVVSNPTFNRWGTSFGKIDTRRLIQKRLNKIINKVDFVEWSVENLQAAARKSDIAIIPIDLRDGFATAKPENKLLSYWTMGVPTLCSPTPAYRRVMSAVGVEDFVVNDYDWGEKFVAIRDRVQSDENFLKSKRLQFQAYLDGFHSREILVRKWDTLIRKYLKSDSNS